MRLRKLILTLTIAVSAVSAFADTAPCIVNIINFVRKTEPRIDAITDEVLYKTTESQASNMLKNGLNGTFLLQYDALIDTKYQELMRALPANFEVGAWWEITRPHVEAAGLKWRGRYPWDWHANVGFATGYTPQEREKLVDVYMEKFKEIFGKYPASVGSWFIDAHTLKYLVDKYHIVASCNCRDQVGTDGYTMWGGYWQGAYYPSKNNAYIPAQTKSRQINVPVFRMLGSDPLYQYECGVGGVVQGVSTLEPVYAAGGGNESWVDWYLQVVTQDPALGYTYFQAGQENSFTWGSMQKGFEMQMPKIAALSNSGAVRLETLEESGRNFAKRYRLTPPTATSALSDYTPRNSKTLWYNSRYYRTNLFWEKGAFRFRDIQIFNEDNKSPYLTAPGTSTECLYFALPFVDGCLWSMPDYMAGLRILERGADGGYKEIRCIGQNKKASGKTATVTINAAGGAQYTVTLKEKDITVSSGRGNGYCLELTTAQGAKTPFAHIATKEITSVRDGFAYFTKLKSGTFTDMRGTPGKICRINPEGKGIVLHLAQK